MTCERCGGWMYRDEYGDLRCISSGHQYVSPEEQRTIAEIARQRFGIVQTERAYLRSAYQRDYQRRRRAQGGR